MATKLPPTPTQGKNTDRLSGSVNEGISERSATQRLILYKFSYKSDIVLYIKLI